MARFDTLLDEHDHDGVRLRYYSLAKLVEMGVGDISRLPFSLKVLLENLVRNDAGDAASEAAIGELAGWCATRAEGSEIEFHPARLMMPESSGLPLIADLAAMRDAMLRLGGDPELVNPIKPVDVIVDHSVSVDVFGRADALRRNMDFEYQRNGERYAFLRWAQSTFRNFRVVPPGVGICHQINLEFLARVVWRDGSMIFPDTLIAMDSHTPMINALGVLGWGAGGIEAGAAMLGQPITMRIPRVIGCRLTGEVPPGVTATDVALTVTQALRAHGVVGTFVEFCGPGLDHLGVTARATIANMAPEYGSTTGFFPVDRRVLDYLTDTGREDAQIRLIESYCRAQGLWRDSMQDEPVYSEIVEVSLSALRRSVSGPNRPHNRIELSDAPASARAAVADDRRSPGAAVAARDLPIRSGDVAIAAITSCTNAGNLELMMQAGLLAHKAREKGLTSRPWVKTSMGPASQIVADLLKAAGLQDDLDSFGFNVVGFGCTTCVGNSGTLSEEIQAAITENDLTVAAVTSANRNFEGRTNPLCRIHYLASPPLVVAYAIAGTLDLDLDADPLGTDAEGGPVTLADIWPTEDEVGSAMAGLVSPQNYRRRNETIFDGDAHWQSLPVAGSTNFDWQQDSLYLRRPPFLDATGPQLEPMPKLVGARVLVMLEDFVTTDHISPVGTITETSEAGRYLLSNGVSRPEFNSFAARRVNHDVMTRGTFGNIRLRNLLAPETEGGYTRLLPDDREVSIYEAATTYRARNVPVIVLAGKEYGAGSSRDWAAKGSYLLGIRAVLAESFERIHRSNLVDMGVVPLEFRDQGGWRGLGLTGEEIFDFDLDLDTIIPQGTVRCRTKSPGGDWREISLTCRIDTTRELEYLQNGGLLPFMLRKLVSDGGAPNPRIKA